MKINEVLREKIIWQDLGEGLSLTDKMEIFEGLIIKENLMESNDEDSKNSFVSLFELSPDPIANTDYFVIPLALINNRVMKLDQPGIFKFISKSDQGMIFQDDHGTKKFPCAAIRERAIYYTFTFDNQEVYSEFGFRLALKFDLTLPDYPR